MRNLLSDGGDDDEYPSHVAHSRPFARDFHCDRREQRISNADEKKAPGGKPCASLTSLALPNTAITVATIVPAGVPPVLESAGLNGAFTGSLPVSICRVAGTITSASPSNIRFEVWMPVATWNGEFNGVGGGVSGFLNYADMALPPNELE